MASQHPAGLALIGALLLPHSVYAAVDDLQVGAMALAGRTSGASEAYSTGGGVALSYSPWWHYTMDLRVSCLTMMSTADTHIGQLDGDDMTERYRERHCDVVTGLSYRLGYPSTIKATAGRFGAVVGLGIGYRYSNRYDRVAWFGTTQGKVRPVESTWEPIVSGKVGVEYLPRSTLSIGLYCYVTSSPIATDEIGIEPTLGLLVSGYY